MASIRHVCCGLLVAGMPLLSIGFAGEAGSGGKPASANRFSPIESAFALPKGTALRPDQQKAYDKMRKDWEPKLKKGMDAVEKAAGNEEKNRAAREVIKLREQIEDEIDDILQMPPPASHQPKTNQNNNHNHHHRNRHRGAVRIRIRD